MFEDHARKKIDVGYKLTSTNRGCAIREASKEPYGGKKFLDEKVCIMAMYNSKTCLKSPRVHETRERQRMKAYSIHNQRDTAGCLIQIL